MAEQHLERSLLVRLDAFLSDRAQTGRELADPATQLELRAARAAFTADCRPRIGRATSAFAAFAMIDR